jgi:hypothetical protein
MAEENKKVIGREVGDGMAKAQEAMAVLRNQSAGVSQDSPPVEGVMPESPPASGVLPDSPPEDDSGASNNAQNRIRQLANERTEARAWAEKLATENQQLRGFAQSQYAAQQQQAVAQAHAQKEHQLKNLQFKEAFPEDGTDDEQLNWKIRKEAHGIATRQTYEGLSAFATMMAPTLAQQAATTRNSEWATVEKSLEPYGASRTKIEGTVETILQQQPHRSLRSAVFDALDMHGYLGTDGAPSVPNVSQPGQGRTDPAAQPTREPSADDVMRDMIGLAKDQGKANRQSDSLNTLANIFQKGRSAN